MASKQVISDAVRVLADAYGKHDSWVEGLVRLLVDHDKLALPEHVTDQACERAASTWATSEAKPPNLQELRAAILRESPPPVRRGCPDCYGSGWRQVLRIWLEEGTTRRKQTAARCTCALGLSLSPAISTWQEARDTARREPGFVAVHVTDRHQRFIPIELEVGPKRAEELRARRGHGASATLLDEVRASVGRPEQRRLPMAQASYHDASEWEG